MRLWPLPRAVHLLVVLLLALVSLAPSSIGGTLIPDAIHARVTATTFQVFGEGRSLDGGLHDTTDVCTYCWIRITITGPGMKVVDPTHPAGIVRELSPGQYELREYRGLFGIYNFGPHDFLLQLEGSGKVLTIS